MKEPIDYSLRLLKQINHHIIEESKLVSESNVSCSKTITLHKIKSLFTHIVTMYKNISTFTEFEKVCIELIEEITQEYNTIII